MTSIPVEFKTIYDPDPVDWVLLAPKGTAFDKVRTWHRVEKLRPPENLSRKERESLRWAVMIGRWEESIGPAYKAWKTGQELPETGTPLAAWPALSVEQVEVLRKMGVRTVEDFRDMDDRSLSELRFPNARRLPGLAAEFLSNKSTVDRDRETAELKERLAAMEALLEEQNAALAARAAEDAPKRRGRPPKSEAA